MKDTQTEEACYDLFSDTIPFFQLANKNEKNDNNQSHMNAMKSCFNKQLTCKIRQKKKETALNYLKKSVKEWLDQQQQN